MSSQAAEGYKMHVTPQLCFESCYMNKTLKQIILGFFKVLLNYAL